MRVVFTAEAKAGLRKSPSTSPATTRPAPSRFVRELRAKAQQLGEMPRAFPLVPAMSRRPFRDYPIFYRVEDDRIVIVHVLHGARDYEALLFPEQ